MTRASIREYREAVRWRYLGASRKDKGKILDEFTKVTGYHRKATIRLLHQVNKPSANEKGCPRQYSAAMLRAPGVAWEATDRLCSKRLQPFLPELVRVLRRHGESTMSADGEETVKLAMELIPDVAVIDIAMSKVNGIEAARQIK